MLLEDLVRRLVRLPEILQDLRNGKLFAVETMEINQTEDFLSPLLVTMFYLDIHPANILLTLFMFHPLPTKKFNSAFPSFSLEKLCLLVVSEP